jgi:hypothetical protein
MTEKPLLSFFTKPIVWIVNFLLTLCMHIQNNDIIPATFKDYIYEYDTLSLTKSILLTADIIRWCTVQNILFAIDDFIFLSQRKKL